MIHYLCGIIYVAMFSHHLASIAQPHWHIDYLLGFSTPTEVWYALSDRKLQREWAETLRHSLRFQIPIPRFGASDYRRTRTTHLFYSKQRPSFPWFEAKVKEAFESSTMTRCDEQPPTKPG